VVNGRFLHATPTGLHKAARSLLDAAIECGMDAEVLTPPETNGRLSDHLWEQLALPRAAGERPVLSLANTAPIAAKHGVVLVHDLAPLIGPQWFVPAVRIYGRLVLTAARRAEHVLTVSNVVAGELVDRGVSAPITVVRNALGPEVRAARAGEVDDVLRKFSVRPPYVLFVGWADPRKDVATAVAAHRLANRTVPHRLVLTGLAHRNFAPVVVPDLDSVMRLGYVADAELCALLTGAAALVYPSRYEGFGLPPLEAWACGTPALVSDIPALRESTEGRATYVSPGVVDAWAAAMLSALRGEIEPPPPTTRTWRDAGRELVDVVREPLG